VCLPQQWTIETLNHVAVVGAALLVAHFARALSDLSPETVDFTLFYGSVRSWREGHPLYEQAQGLVNYNSPQFHILILPLASMPVGFALAAWTAISAGAAALTIRMAMTEAGGAWSPQEQRLLLAGVLIAAGVGAAVHLGQVSWVIALLVTLGWRAARRDRWVVSGAWLGVAASLKPFLLLVLMIFVVRRRWNGLVAAAAAAAVCTAIGVLVFGTSSLGDWLRLLSAGAPPQQMAYFINASLAAPFARVGLGPAVYRTVGLIVVMLTILRARNSGVDQAFLLLLIGSLLASPLGWIYYMPILAGPLIVMARRRELPGRAWCVWPLLACPAISRDFLQFDRALAITLGSSYTWGLVILWLAAASAGTRGASMGSMPASWPPAS
jgi:hypothetical protein